ncbi:hypothetical protein PCANC_18113 [Puccinia coronata f. sp. avenae]|uniref:Uncharacterized protein n=1 Tax=Puccinia coronata f. sp. avenae TaxID=200324 RepID=A0A2N5SL81_9BASI|nr:hypothetical protein PCANC_18113 [Puccinia coronata f. sp. avenae]
MKHVLVKETQVQDVDELSTTEDEVDKLANDPTPYHLRSRKTEVNLEYSVFMENFVPNEPSQRKTQTAASKLWTQRTSKPDPPPAQLEAQPTTQIKAVEILDEGDFGAFVREAIRVYPSKVIVQLSMDDPRKIVKNRASETQARDLLAMQFGPPAVRATIERQHQHQAFNAKADVADSLHPIVAKLRVNIAKNSAGSNSEYPTFINPYNPSKEMRILHKELWTWGEAIRDNIPGVDYTHPPEGPQYPNFQWRLRRGFENQSHQVPVAPKQPLVSEGSPFPAQVPRTLGVNRPHAGHHLATRFNNQSPSIIIEEGATGPASDVEVMRSTPGNHNGWVYVPEQPAQTFEDPRNVDNFTFVPATPHIENIPLPGHWATNQPAYPTPLSEVTHHNTGAADVSSPILPIVNQPALPGPVKEPAAQVDLAAPGVPPHPNAACPKIPLHTIHPPFPPELENVNMEEYLRVALIPAEDEATRIRLTLLGITEWTYFQSTSYESLVSDGFLPGVAHLLCHGVGRLAAHYLINI